MNHCTFVGGPANGKQLQVAADLTYIRIAEPGHYRGPMNDHIYSIHLMKDADESDVFIALHPDCNPDRPLHALVTAFNQAVKESKRD